MFYAISFILLAFALLIAIRNPHTFKKHTIVVDAIYRYKFAMIEQHDWTLPGGITYAVDYEDMESYSKTLFRFWDWGYEHLLPPDKYEIIKPYIDILEAKRE